MERHFDGVEQSWNTASMNFAAADPYKAEQDIMHILIEAGLPTGNLYNAQKIYRPVATSLP